MKRVAIPISNNRLSEFFGECEHYEIYEVDGKITGRKTVVVPGGINSTELPAWLGKYGVTDVITFKVNPKIIRYFVSRKVNLYVGIPTDLPENLMKEYMLGRLESDERIIRELINSEL